MSYHSAAVVIIIFNHHIALTVPSLLNLSIYPSLSSISPIWSSRMHFVFAHYWQIFACQSIMAHPLENGEFILTSLAMPHMSCSSYSNGSENESQAGIQLLFWRNLLWEFVQDNTQHSWIALIQYVLLVFMWCIHVVVWTQPQRGKYRVWFYQIDQISIFFYVDITFN